MKKFYKVEDIISNQTKIKKVFFFRICGTGMGAAAALLKDAGYIVEGADNDFYPPMSTYLENSGIPLKKISDCTDQYLQEFDLVIVGNVVPNGSNDAIRLEKLNIPLTSFPQALGGLLLSKKKVVGIAGTHGKTTTTYLSVQVFRNLGIDPGYLIGGVLPEGESACLGKDDLFFIEADEYDTAYFEKTSKFHHYEINHLILTSLEFDHADIFATEKDILNSFDKLFKRKLEKVIICDDYSMTKELIEKYDVSQIYGEKSNNGPINIKMNSNGSTFDLLIDQKLEKFSTDLIGIHNILNLSAIILLAYELDYSLPQIKSSILHLKMVKRRQELRGKINQAEIYDDFAHHPTAVIKTLEGFKKGHPDKKLVVVFEPASSTARSNLFQDRFAGSFDDADVVYIIRPTRPTTVIKGSDLDLDLLKSSLEKKQKIVEIIDTIEQLELGLNRYSAVDHVIICLSNGKVLNLFSSPLIQKC